MKKIIVLMMLLNCFMYGKWEYEILSDDFGDPTENKILITNGLKDSSILRINYDSSYNIIFPYFLFNDISCKNFINADGIGQMKLKNEKGEVLSTEITFDEETQSFYIDGIDAAANISKFLFASKEIKIVLYSLYSEEKYVSSFNVEGLRGILDEMYPSWTYDGEYIFGTNSNGQNIYIQLPASREDGEYANILFETYEFYEITPSITIKMLINDKDIIKIQGLTQIDEEDRMDAGFTFGLSIKYEELRKIMNGMKNAKITDKITFRVVDSKGKKVKDFNYKNDGIMKIIEKMNLSKIKDSI